MPSAEIIAIGTELLLGEILDTNTRHIARALRDAGVDLYRTSAVGDNVSRIARMIQESLSRVEIVITTGGLGPTVDDPTRDAVAQAMGVPTEYRPDLWEQILDRYARYGREPSENNKRQAFIPAGAIPVQNPVGTAPAFIFETESRCVISLPGVPREMEYLLDVSVLPYLRKRFSLQGIIVSRVLHTASLGESLIDEKIDDLERLINPTVGLLAHPGQTDIRIAAKANTREEAETAIEAVAQEVRARLGLFIYGEGEQTLARVTLDQLAKQNLRLVVVEAGLKGVLASEIDMEHPACAGVEILPPATSPDGLREHLLDFAAERGASAALSAALSGNGELQELNIAVHLDGKTQEARQTYGGAPQNAPIWAAHLAIDFLRRFLIKHS